MVTGASMCGCAQVLTCCRLYPGTRTGFFLAHRQHMATMHVLKSTLEGSECTFPPLVRVEVAAAHRRWRQLTNAAQQLRIAIVKWHSSTWYALDAGAW